MFNENDYDSEILEDQLTEETGTVTDQFSDLGVVISISMV